MAAPRSAGRALLLLASRARDGVAATAARGGATPCASCGGVLTFASTTTAAAGSATAAATTTTMMRPVVRGAPSLPAPSWRAFSSSGSGGPASAPAASAPAAPAAAAAARTAPAAAAAAAAPPPLPLPRGPPPLPKIRSADQLSPEELHAALPSMLFTTSNLILSTLVAAAVAAVGLIAMFWLGTNLRHIAGGPAKEQQAPRAAAPAPPPPSLAEMVRARRRELEAEAAGLRALPQTREVRARAAEVRRELAVFSRGGGAGGWLDAGAWWRWLTGRGGGGRDGGGGAASSAAQ